MIEPVLAIIDPVSLLIYAGVSAGTTGLMGMFSRRQAKQDAARLERQRLDAERAAALEEGATEKFLEQLRSGDISRARNAEGGFSYGGSILGGVEDEQGGGLLQ
jgi:hypothetical protein